MRPSGFLCRSTRAALHREPRAKLLLHHLLPLNCCMVVPAATALLSQSLCCCCHCCHINKPCPAARLPPPCHPSCRGITAPLLSRTHNFSIPHCC